LSFKGGVIISNFLQPEDEKNKHILWQHQITSGGYIKQIQINNKPNIVENPKFKKGVSLKRGSEFFLPMFVFVFISTIFVFYCDF